MALGDFGTSTGLAYRHNWQGEIDNVYRNEAIEHKMKADQEVKARLLGDKLKLGFADNPYDRGKLDEYTTTHMKAIGEHLMKNPNVMADPMAWMKYQQMAGQLADNEWTRAAARYDKEAKKFSAAIAKDHLFMESKEGEDMLAEMNNYKKYGSIDGIEANRKEFMFRDVDTAWDINADAAAIVQGIEANKVGYKGPGAGWGATKEYRTDEQLMHAALSTINNSPNKSRWLRLYNETIEKNPDMKGVYDTPEKYVFMQLKAKSGEKINYGQYVASARTQDSDGGGQDRNLWAPFRTLLSNVENYGQTQTPHLEAISPAYNDPTRVGNPKVIDINHGDLVGYGVNSKGQSYTTNLGMPGKLTPEVIRVSAAAPIKGLKGQMLMGLETQVAFNNEDLRTIVSHTNDKHKGRADLNPFGTYSSEAGAFRGLPFITPNFMDDNLIEYAVQFTDQKYTVTMDSKTMTPAWFAKNESKIESIEPERFIMKTLTLPVINDLTVNDYENKFVTEKDASNLRSVDARANSKVNNATDLFQQYVASGQLSPNAEIKTTASGKYYAVDPNGKTILLSR